MRTTRRKSKPAAPTPPRRSSNSSSRVRPLTRQAGRCSFGSTGRFFYRDQLPNSNSDFYVLSSNFPMSFGIAPPGFRLPDATHVGRVRLQIADLQRSIDYYERVLGLRTMQRVDGTATLAAQG